MNGLRKALPTQSLILVVLFVVSCTPAHNVKPLPDFVRTGIEVGDRVIVTSHAGEVSEFVVTENRVDTLIGEDIEIDLADAARIQVYGWERPDSPCGGDKPLGCSLPILISLASEEHAHYKEEFYDACAQHDYCYRHGFASYGLDRKACDTEFLQGMQALCPEAAKGTMGKVLQSVDGSTSSRGVCLRIADDYHAAVRRYGEKKFLSTTSTYCEYNGPPDSGTSSSAPRASAAPAPGISIDSLNSR